MPSQSPQGYAGQSFKFTEARIDAARRAARIEDADTSGRRSWRDEDCKGLTLVVNVRTGNAAFYFRGKLDGKTTRRALGDVDVVTLKEARQAVGTIQYDRSAAATFSPRPTESDADAAPADDSPLLADVADAMLDAHAAGRWLPGNRSKPPSDRTVKFYRDLRRAQLAPHEAKTLRQFAGELPTVYATLQAKAPIQANRFLQLVRNVYGYAAASGQWDAANPALGTAADKLTRTPEQARTRTLSDAEWKRLAQALEQDQPLWRDLFTMSLLTLQRMGAVCHMRWDDVSLDEDDAVWRIPARYMKGRRAGHVVPLGELPQALDILRTRRGIVPAKCPWVFPAAEGDGGPARNYDKAWDRIIRRAGLWSEDRDQRPRPHDLRRTGGARMTTAGVPLQTVTRALGDAPSSVGMVARVYAQVADDALRSAYRATSKPQRRRR